jgi:hypothetical protein
VSTWRAAVSDKSSCCAWFAAASIANNCSDNPVDAVQQDQADPHLGNCFVLLTPAYLLQVGEISGERRVENHWYMMLSNWGGDVVGVVADVTAGLDTGFGGNLCFAVAGGQPHRIEGPDLTLLSVRIYDGGHAHFSDGHQASSQFWLDD